MNRRSFLKTAPLAAAAPALTALPPQAHAQTSTQARTFPQGFLWGSATASYQVEGAVHEDGRGTTVWDTFSHTPGKVHNGDTGDVADDYYHRYPQDIELMQSIGLKTCRFSIAWSRIFPDGTGTPNQKGIDFYKRMTEALRAHGVEPYCTLYHWDLPQALQDKGGWENPDLPKLFADYCAYTAKALGSNVTHYMTLNEMRSFVEIGYGNGVHAPGLKLPLGRLAQVRHHAVLAHGHAVQALRASAPAGTRIGIADNADVMIPVQETPEHIAAARRAFREQNAMYLTVLMDGKYTDAYLAKLGADAPKFTPEELKIIASPMDFLGLNVYTGSYVRAAEGPLGYSLLHDPETFPRMASPWLHVTPEALYWSPRHVHDIWGVKQMFITENGCSSADTVSPDGHIYDPDRVMYFRNYLTHLHRAVSEGIPVQGYFLWSLLDNFEWADGYDKRFGITYVDFQTQKRTLKLSGEYYKQVIAQNAVV